MAISKDFGIMRLAKLLFQLNGEKWRIKKIINN
jgi:hypothetical protein